MSTLNYNEKIKQNYLIYNRTILFLFLLVGPEKHFKHLYQIKVQNIVKNTYKTTYIQ